MKSYLLFVGIVLLILVVAISQRLNKTTQTTPSQTVTSGTIKLIKSGTISQFLRTYSYWIYENTKYPCGKQGNHTFIVIQKGATDDVRHLLVRHTGGFAGFYYPNSSGQLSYFPDSSFEGLLYEDTFTSSIAARGLDRLIINTAGWRIMSPSYCSHDFYLGKGQYNSTDGFTRWGYLADTEAIDFTQNQFPTDKIVTYGTSAGSSGAFYQGIVRSNVVGIVMDSFAVDLESLIQACDQGVQPYYSKWPCTCNGQTCVSSIAKRIGFAQNDQPYMKISNKEVHTPMYLVYNTNDYLYNGHVDLQFSNLQTAINKYNPGGKSKVVPVCVNDPALPAQTCNMHSPTLENNQASQGAYNWILALVK